MVTTAPRPTAACWFEIPALDFERAVAFYEGLFAVELRREDFGDLHLAVFPYGEPGVGGAVANGHGLTPSEHGSVVYLNADGKLDAMLDRVERLGGRIALPRTALPGDRGDIAMIQDCEGNRIGLHAVA